MCVLGTEFPAERGEPDADLLESDGGVSIQFVECAHRRFQLDLEVHGGVVETRLHDEVGLRVARVGSGCLDPRVVVDGEAGCNRVVDDSDDGGAGGNERVCGVAEGVDLLVDSAADALAGHPVTPRTCRGGRPAFTVPSTERGIHIPVDAVGRLPECVVCGLNRVGSRGERSRIERADRGRRPHLRGRSFEVGSDGRELAAEFLLGHLVVPCGRFGGLGHASQAVGHSAVAVSSGAPARPATPPTAEDGIAPATDSSAADGSNA
ncbi:hypothetical protein M1C57_13355 [Rhodococcus pyridinivorans]|uniref:hypothetical protein n=1 Tax=Rhodococcus pyridinivorans TaxID=103816 RepID=UPI00200B0A45|nr:hypothetical protein [Rhodococcus pyridinivorans]UPW02707.1 hypothetical protein M1C57_13355 [Rhodococcus pyridinivorans]